MEEAHTAQQIECYMITFSTQAQNDEVALRNVVEFVGPHTGPPYVTNPSGLGERIRLSFCHPEIIQLHP